MGPTFKWHYALTDALIFQEDERQANVIKLNIGYVVISTKSKAFT